MSQEDRIDDNTRNAILQAMVAKPKVEEKVEENIEDIVKAEKVPNSDIDPSQKSFNSLLEESLNIRAKQDKVENNDKEEVREAVIDKVKPKMESVMKNWRF